MDEYDHDYVHDATQAEHEEEEHYQTKTDDAGGFDVHGEDASHAPVSAFDAPVDGGGDAGDRASSRERRKVEQLKKSQSNLILLLIVTPLVLVGA